MKFFRKIISFNFTFRYFISVFALVLIILQELKLMDDIEVLFMSFILMMWVAITFVLNIIASIGLKGSLSGNNYSYKKIFYTNLINIMNDSLLPLILSIKNNNLTIIILVVILILDKFHKVSTSNLIAFEDTHEQKTILSDNACIKKINAFLSTDTSSSRYKKGFFKIITVGYVIIINGLFFYFLFQLINKIWMSMTHLRFFLGFVGIFGVYIIIFVFHYKSIKDAHEK